MVCYWQWVKRYLFTQKWNQIFNKFIKIKSYYSDACYYSDAYILITGISTVTRRNDANTEDIALSAAIQVVFKNCAPLKDCRTEINDTFVDYAGFINITMPIYNLIEYSHNYYDTSGRSRSFKRYEIVGNADVTNNDNAPSFKYKEVIIGDTENNGTKKKYK